MDFWRHDYVIPILAAIAAGGLIGWEREFRGRAAGIRTHILVCLASTLLMLAAVYQVEWMHETPHDVIRIDPVRMAHGVLTGIGFLCAGVIFREGFSIRGLTTAASLWITCALGLLYGAGLNGLAISGTVATLLVLAGLRLLGARLPRLHHADVVIRYARAQAPTEAEFLAVFAAYGMKPDVVVHRLLDADQGVELASTLRGKTLDSDRITQALLADPRILAFELAPRHE